MELKGLSVTQDFLRPVEQLSMPKELEKQNPNVQQNIQIQMIKEATTSPSSPTAQGTQLLATVQATAEMQQVMAQQQISSGYLDIKI